MITKEYPVNFQIGMEPYYPVNDRANNLLYEKYRELAQKQENAYFGGRLAEYKYYNMDQIVKRAFMLVEEIKAKEDIVEES